MYITNQGYGGYRRGEQFHTKAPFLILVQYRHYPVGPDNFRALVRKVALRQSGHFMTGIARVLNTSLVLSGAYGSDGLPYTTENYTIYEAAVPVPGKLYDLWAKGNGWNGAGSEAGKFREWAVKKFMTENYMEK